MIYFNFSLVNPFGKNNSHRQIFTKNGGITKNKFWEICVTKQKGLIISFGINWTTKQSHAGFDIDFGAFGYSMSLVISDDRHWNYTNNCWEENQE